MGIEILYTVADTVRRGEKPRLTVDELNALVDPTFCRGLKIYYKADKELRPHESAEDCINEIKSLANENCIFTVLELLLRYNRSMHCITETFPQFGGIWA